MRTKTFLIMVLIIFLTGLIPISCLIIGSQEYLQGYSNGNTDGYMQGYRIGQVAGYGQGYPDGENYIECWVMHNHPYVYSFWFNDAFSGVYCP